MTQNHNPIDVTFWGELKKLGEGTANALRCLIEFGAFDANQNDIDRKNQ